MRQIDPGIITAIQTGQIKPFICIKITLAEYDPDHVYAYTTCDVPIYISGVEYQPRGITPGEISYSMGQIVDQANLTIDNLDDEMTSDFVGATPQGNEIVIYGVYLDSTNQIIGTPATLFIGEIDEWNMSEGVLDITISNQFSQWNQVTLSQHSSSCRWKKFKGTECGYVGVETVCDRTWQTCDGFSNTANFGGFRFLPYLERTTLFWGMAGPGGGPS